MVRRLVPLLLAAILAAVALPPATADVIVGVSVHETPEAPATTTVATCSFFVKATGLLSETGLIRIFDESSPPVEVASVAFHAQPIGGGLYATAAGPILAPAGMLHPVVDHAPADLPDVSMGPRFENRPPEACAQAPTLARPCTVTGFLPPIGTPGHTLESGVQRFKHGQTIPVKIKAVCPDGAVVATPRIFVAQMIGETAGAETAATTKSSGYASNHMRWHGHHWHYNLDTRVMPKGMCLLRVDVGDGYEHSVMVLLR